MAQHQSAPTKHWCGRIVCVRLARCNLDACGSNRCHFGLRFTPSKKDHRRHDEKCEEPDEGHAATVASGKEHAGER